MSKLGIKIGMASAIATYTLSRKTSEPFAYLDVEKNYDKPFYQKLNDKRNKRRFTKGGK